MKMESRVTAGEMLLQRDVETVLKYSIELRLLLREIEQKKQQIMELLARISRYSTPSG